MKRTVILAIILMMLVSLFSSITVTVSASEAEVVLRFVAMADAHLSPDYPESQTRFDKAMDKFYEIAGADKNHSTVDAIVFVGDFVEKHQKEDFDVFNDAIKASVKPETKVLACLGNHEYYPNKSGGGTAVDSTVAEEFLQDYLGIESLDTSVDINGFRFVLSSLRNDIKTGKYWNDKANIDWLEQEISEAAAADPKKPIFTFAHITLKNTVATTFFSQWYHDNGFGTTYDVYKQYPQVVHFTGHDHVPLNFENAIHQRDFTTVIAGHMSTGCVGMLQDEISWTNAKTAQTLLVEVDKNNTVTIKKYDILNDTFIGEDWVIENPSDKSGFVYTDDRAEKYEGFAFEEQLALTETSSNSIKVSFKSIKSNPNIMYYRLTAYEGDKQVYKSVIKSDIWLKDAPTAFEGSVGSLKPDTEYTVKVVAVDSFGNLSEPLTLVAKTDAPVANPVNDPSTKIYIYDDLSKMPEGEAVLDSSSASIKNNDFLAYCAKGYNSKAKFKFADGKITVLSNPGTLIGPVKLKFGEDIKNVPGVKGFGFYIENNLSKQLKIEACASSSQYIRSDPECTIFTLDINGNQKEHIIASDRSITLDKGFKGWVFVPVESVVDGHKDYSKFDGSEMQITTLLFSFNGTFKEGEGSIVYDNFFVYGDVEDNNNGRIDLSVATTPEPTEKPTAGPTAKPDQTAEPNASEPAPTAEPGQTTEPNVSEPAPTAEPGQTAEPNASDPAAPTAEPDQTAEPNASEITEPAQSNMTWVYIVIAVALVAIVAVAVILLKKKQNK